MHFSRLASYSGEVLWCSVEEEKKDGVDSPFLLLNEEHC